MRSSDTTEKPVRLRFKPFNSGAKSNKQMPPSCGREVRACLGEEGSLAGDCMEPRALDGRTNPLLSTKHHAGNPPVAAVHHTWEQTDPLPLPDELLGLSDSRKPRSF